MSNLIIDYINQDPVSFIHITDLLDKNYTIIFESSDGFIIKDNDSGILYMSFSNTDTMKKELSKKRYEHYISYDKEVVDYYSDEKSVMILSQYFYPSNNSFDLGDYDIRVLDETYAPFIDSFYKAINPGESSIYVLKKRDVLGLFENNELAGIIGRHPEGCVGMLHIFEKFRGKGYATILEKAMINKLINEKQRVFCEVVEGNTISEHLQEKLGYIKGKKKMYWLV